ncbi:rod shape-determining protein [Alicyclobacillus sp.]|uniref:rod shape-determining protein n=1 Tax=Alicyclobacillus sp. TaxID=61169 RepID=UPI0025B84EE8|nr:rod shape-determining protein [Alicyclobacillus sp.]MCL6517019.1 rod shape-determining protein [Alicyclobacillus sp.]
MHVGIDLGTSHLRAAWMDRRAETFVDEPAVVALSASGHPTIGREAEAMIGRHPDAIRVVRPVDGGIVRDFDATVLLIQHAIRRLGAEGLGRRLTITLAVPSGQSQVDRKAMEEAARSAGARAVQFVESSIAAAVGAELPIHQPTGCLVVQMGGGVTEAALLSMGGIVDSRSLRMGGQALDTEIAELLRRQYSFLIGQPSAQHLKHQASGGQGASATPGDILEVRGRNLETGMPGTLSVPRALVEQVIDAHIERMVQLIREAIEACPPELVGDILDHGVILTGGGAQMGRAVSRLAAQVEVPVAAADNPSACVVRGLTRMLHPRAVRPARRFASWRASLNLSTLPVPPIRRWIGRSGTRE